MTPNRINDDASHAIEPSPMRTTTRATQGDDRSTHPTAPILLGSLRRRWKSSLVAGLVCGAVAAAAVWFAVPQAKYTARTMLRVSSLPPRVIFNTAENRPDFGTYQRTQLSLIKSRFVLLAALRDPKMHQLPTIKKQVDPVAWLEKQIKAEYMGEILSISVSGESTEELPIIVNAVTDAYLKEVVLSEDGFRRTRYDDLLKIYGEYESRLKERRKVLKGLAKQLGSNDKKGARLKQEIALERAALVEKEQVQIQNDLRRAQAELQIRESIARREQTENDEASDELVQEQLEKDPQIIQLRTRVMQMEAAVKRVRIQVRSASEPELVKRTNDLKTTRQALAARLAQQRPVVLDRLRAERARDGSDVALLRERVEVLTAMEKATAAVVQIQSTASEEITQHSLDLESIQDDIALADNAAKRIGEEIEALKVELLAPSRVKKIESADAPRPEEDKRIQLSAAAGLGGMALVVFAIAYGESRARRIGSIDDVIRCRGLRVVGTLPRLPESSRRSVGVVSGDEVRHGQLIESVDSLRTMLLHSPEGDSPRTMVVTSAVAGEGKTTLSCHLAVSMARAGFKTLLIDCDLRNPTVHRMFDLPLTPGFNDLLRGDADFDELVNTYTEGSLSVITGGVCDGPSIQALARADLKALFERSRERYDFIVIDTSPVLPVADALMVGRHADAVICSVLRDVSRQPKIFAACERLEAVGIRVFGAVVTGIRTDVYDSAYSYPVVKN